MKGSGPKRSARLANIACGVDVIDMEQFVRDLELGGKAFLERIYTEDELKWCGARPESLAVRFAAKEATTKALGTGIRGVGWREIEVVSTAEGAPKLVLRGRAANRARKLGLDSWSVSVSHSKQSAIAFVVAAGMGEKGLLAEDGLNGEEEKEVKRSE